MAEIAIHRQWATLRRAGLLGTLIAALSCAPAPQAATTPAAQTPVAPAQSAAAGDPLAEPAARADKPMGPIGGVYELCIGTRDAAAMIEYWQQFGFSEGPRGELSAADAQKLYGVSSRLTSIRMQHQSADHGLVRIMVWDKPVNNGLELRKMRVLGNRWGAMLTANVLAVANHAEVAKAKGQPVETLGPMWDVIYGSVDKLEPFKDKLAGVREMMLLRPETRQFLFQRFGYALPDYGAVNQSAPLPTSQFTHVGLIIRGDNNDVLRFYDEVLGLMRVKDTEGVSTYEGSPSGRQIFGIGLGERYFSTNFDDPRSSRTELAKVRSGRLKIIRYPASLDVQEAHHLSRPGSLGLSLYTYQVRDIAAYHAKVSRSAATNVTPVLVNELGERSFSFVAPDGYYWNLVEKPRT